MPLDHLNTIKSARFFTRNGRLLSSEINSAFDRIGANATAGTSTERIVKRRMKVGKKYVRVSYLRFEFEAEPSFLRGSTLTEKKHAYVLIAELLDLTAVFKKHVTNPTKAHIIQLLWILSSFVNGCLEAGAKPEVYCSP
jgi:hypothetical protein